MISGASIALCQDGCDDLKGVCAFETRGIDGRAYVRLGLGGPHCEHIRKKFKQRPADSRIITLNIPDEYERGDPGLIELLKSKVTHRLDLMMGNG